MVNMHAGQHLTYVAVDYTRSCTAVDAYSFFFTFPINSCPNIRMEWRIVFLTEFRVPVRITVLYSERKFINIILINNPQNI